MPQTNTSAATRATTGLACFTKSGRRLVCRLVGSLAPATAILPLHDAAIPSEISRVILCLRDPRDEAVSQWKSQTPMGISDYDDSKRGRSLPVAASGELLSSLARLPGVDVLVVHYEDLFSDYGGIVDRLARFLGASVSGSAVQSLRATHAPDIVANRDSAEWQDPERAVRTGDLEASDFPGLHRWAASPELIGRLNAEVAEDPPSPAYAAVHPEQLRRTLLIHTGRGWSDRSVLEQITHMEWGGLGGRLLSPSLRPFQKARAVALGDIPPPEEPEQVWWLEEPVLYDGIAAWQARAMPGDPCEIIALANARRDPILIGPREVRRLPYAVLGCKAAMWPAVRRWIQRLRCDPAAPAPGTLRLLTWPETPLIPSFPEAEAGPGQSAAQPWSSSFAQRRRMLRQALELDYLKCLSRPVRCRHSLTVVAPITVDDLESFSEIRHLWRFPDNVSLKLILCEGVENEAVRDPKEASFAADCTLWSEMPEAARRLAADGHWMPAMLQAGLALCEHAQWVLLDPAAFPFRPNRTATLFHEWDWNSIDLGPPGSALRDMAPPRPGRLVPDLLKTWWIGSPATLFSKTFTASLLGAWRAAGMPGDFEVFSTQFANRTRARVKPASLKEWGWRM